jgi:DNA-binding XRE family transcriptional regulator
MRAADVVLVAQIRADLRSGRAREGREAARAGQREIAQALGVSRAAVSHWEAGRSVPSAEHALAYGRLLSRLAQASRR